MANNPLKLAQGFPGQMGLLAKQMANGFGGGLLAQQQYLNSIYDPVVMPQTWDYGGTNDGDKDKTKGGKKDTGGRGMSGVNTLDPMIWINGRIQPNPNYVPTRRGSDR